METKTFEQITAEAKKIHPDAFARLNEYTENWEIVIPTEYEESDEPDESWADTPAGEALKEYEPNYGSTLHRWRYKNGYEGSSLAATAAEFNMMYESTCYEQNLWEEKLRNHPELPYHPLEKQPSDEEYTDEQRKIVKKIMKEARKETQEYMILRRKQVDKMFVR
jgi:vacuolar-type H+-ATPase subunit H